MTVQDLRDVLRERAEGPSPANPARPEQVGAHIRRIRRRRRVAGGAAASVTAAAVLFGAWLVPGAAEQPQKATIATGAVAKLPERFTAPDGTEYRRVATTAIEAAGDGKAVVTVPFSGRPLDVAGVCEGADAGPLRVSAGARTTPIGFRGCTKAMQLHPLPVPATAGEVTVTFDTTTRGTACVRARSGGPCEPVKAERGDWSLAVYEWTPPAQPVEPGPVKDLPRRLDGWELTTSKTGVWPRDTTARFEIAGTGRKLAFEQICGGDLASRLLVHTSTGLGGAPQSTTCAEWKKGPFPMAMTEFPAVPKGERMVVTVRISMIGESTNRPVRWSFGLYSK
ncbi:hypothetical protein ACIBQX_02780 [Nonomuraea sp. NPDC049714]|uniref:hypothetical protein n=1 Tax=Nonomuraea sp. NPDC049714 TaxID=3364357 RepID=UPI003798C678